MDKNYAPILLFVYNRPAHTRNIVESLLANSLAGQSELFIFSDEAKDDDDNKYYAVCRNTYGNSAYGTFRSSGIDQHAQGVQVEQRLFHVEHIHVVWRGSDEPQRDLLKSGKDQSPNKSSTHSTDSHN